MTQPNILVIMADQLTASLTGAYGHSLVKTPNLDRLCRDGVRFDAAYTNCPLCAPARAAMFSGQYVSRTRAFGNASPFPCDTPTFAHALRLAGYEVTGAGKMHFIGADQLHGLERRLTTDIYPSDFSWAMGREKLDELMQLPLAGKWKDFGVTAGPCDWSWQLDYDAEVQFRTLEYLRAHRRGAPRPFCLFMSYSHPHPPYLPPQKYWDMYEDVEIDLPTIPENLEALRSPLDRWLHYFEGIPDEALREPDVLRRLRRAYYAMVSYVDAQVGELFDTLDDMGMREQTAVLFTADHGDQLGERLLLEKLNFYEASARIPLIGRFPGHWPGGRVSDEPVSLIDVFPTLCEMAGAPVPPGVEGRSFCDLLEGRPSASPERLAISESHGDCVQGLCFMVRKGTFKYIYLHGHGKQLFDLRSDPREERNLAGQPEMAEIEAALQQELVTRFDFDTIDAEVLRSQQSQIYLRDAMRQGTHTSWNYQPFFEASTEWSR